MRFTCGMHYLEANVGYIVVAILAVIKCVVDGDTVFECYRFGRGYLLDQG